MPVPCGSPGSPQVGGKNQRTESEEKEKDLLPSASGRKFEGAAT